MKAWKRSLALLLTAAMVLTMGVMAFAAEEAGNGEASPLGDMTGKIVILHTNDTHGHDVADAETESLGTAAVAQLKKDYEAAGYAVFAAAYEKAKAVYEDETATGSEVEAARQDLKDAIAKLVPADNTKTKLKVNAEGSVNTSSNVEDSQMAAPVKSVKTGDAADVLATIVTILLAGGAIIVSATLLKNRRNKKK